MPLQTIEPSGLNAIGDEDLVELDVAVDSGVAEGVMYDESLNGVIDITEGAACKEELCTKSQAEYKSRT